MVDQKDRYTTFLIRLAMPRTIRTLRNIELFDVDAHLQRIWAGGQEPGLVMFGYIVDCAYQNPVALVEELCSADHKRLKTTPGAAACVMTAKLMETIEAALAYYADPKGNNEAAVTAPAYWPGGQKVDWWQHRQAWARVLFLLQMKVTPAKA